MRDTLTWLNKAKSRMGEEAMIKQAAEWKKMNEEERKRRKEEERKVCVSTCTRAHAHTSILKDTLCHILAKT